jgi:hypothetical protein
VHGEVSEQTWPWVPVPAGRQSTILWLPSVVSTQPQPAGHRGSLIAVGSQLLVHSNTPGIGWSEELKS